MKAPWSIAILVTFAVTLGCDPVIENNKPQIGIRTRTSANLQSFNTCQDLAASLRSNLQEEMRVYLLSLDDYWYYGPMDGDANAPTAGGAESSGGGQRTEGVDYSGTNNQETGVDEADFVKTDGYFIYTLNGNRLEIMGVPEFGELTHVSSTTVEGHPMAMLIGDDKIVVFSNIYTYNLPEDHPLRAFVGRDEDGYGWWWRSQVLTKLTVINIADRANPQTLRQMYLEGYYQTARKVESSVRMISFSWMDIAGMMWWPELPDDYYNLDYDDPRRQQIWDNAVIAAIRHNDAVIAQTPLSDFVPQIYERFQNDAVVEHPFTTSSCTAFQMAQDGMSHGFSSILSLDLLGPTFAFDADHIVSNWSTVYASTDTLLIAEPSHDWWWFWNNDNFDEASNIHRFDISVAGQTRYTGSGRVDGHLRNQFSLSEHNDFVRVASTTGFNRWWSDEPREFENHVFVLAGENSLEEIGHVGGIAMGEQIWASRFIGDKGYLVTFLQIDPLWTIDLSRPGSPEIIGELEVPGVSTYIHPLGDDHLLTIGYGGDENGLDWATQVSIFDVSNFAAPALSSALSLAPEVEGDGWTYAWSEANWEHKAFQYWGPMSMLAIPLSTYRYVYDDVGYYSHYEYVSMLQLINVDTGAGLSRHGTVDHSDFFNQEQEYWWDWRDVRRSIFMGDFIYAISDRGVTASRISDMSMVASVDLPGTGYDEWYWGW